MKRVAILVACLPACSAFAVQGPGAHRQFQEVSTCTTSRVAPVADLFIGAAFATPTAVLGIKTASDYPGNDHIAALGIAIGVLLGSTPWWLSAREGFRRTSQCRDERSEVAQARLRAAREAAQQQDCAAVEELEADVLALDLDFHARRFVPDVEIIRRCPTRAWHTSRTRVGERALRDVFEECARLHDVGGTIAVWLRVDDYQVVGQKIVADGTVARLDALRACVRVRLAGMYMPSDRNWASSIMLGK